MKEISLIALALFSSVTVLFAQNDRPASRANWNPENYKVGQIYPGFIVDLRNDTTYGFIKAGYRCPIEGMGESNQTHVNFYKNETDAKPSAKYKPDQLLAYQIADKKYESLNYSGGLFKSPNFNLIVEDGAIKTYEWYATVEDFLLLKKQNNETWEQFDARRFDIKLIIAKNPKNPQDFSMLGLSFAKKMPALISDNEELARKVANKEKGYGMFQIFEVIREYNDWAKNK